MATMTLMLTLPLSCETLWTTRQHTVNVVVVQT